jgi:hypothetical protein
MMGDEIPLQSAAIWARRVEAASGHAILVEIGLIDERTSVLVNDTDPGALDGFVSCPSA